MAAIGKRLTKIEIDSEEQAAVLTNVRLSAADADGDVLTFDEAASGGAKEWHLIGTAVQDIADDTVWDMIWSNSGATVTYTYMPFGNETPTTAQPHFTGSVVIGEADGDFIGGDADKSPTARQTFDFDWVCTAKPTKKTSNGG